MSHEQIAAEALKLPHKERAALASQLLRSLDELSEAECEELWIEEVDRRIRAMRQGRTEGIRGEDVFARGRAILAP